MSLSLISEALWTMVAPEALAIRLLSVFLRRRIAVIPARARNTAARSLRPFSVTTRSGLNWMMVLHICSIHSSSALRRAAQSSSLVISTFVWFSPFLYSMGQSISRILGFSIFLFIRPGRTTSLLNMTPLSTVQSSSEPPGSFSILAYFLMSTSVLPSPRSLATQSTASRASSEMSVPNRCVNLVPMQLCTSLSIWSLFFTSMGKQMSSTALTASSRALM
mmetsp:Transcript_5449/g.14079  ORF Transcript_5449/g.14079 Transcript_5449/m.14079 type:complete len:220 (-) Transcript_5449:492-1151(-)